MREKFAVARQAQRELAEYIRNNPQLTWFDIAVNKSVSICTVSKTAKLFGLSRTMRKTDNHNHVDATQEIL